MKLFGNPIRAALFDVDGVILNLMANFEDNLIESIPDSRQVCAVEKFFDGIHNGARQKNLSFNGMLREIWPQITDEQIKEWKLQMKITDMKNPAPLVEGARETIEWLKENKIEVGICTNNSFYALTEKFRHVNLPLTLFDLFCTSEYGLKPDISILEPLYSAGIPPRNTVFLGDWFPDIYLAKNSGLEFLGVLSGLIRQRYVYLHEGIPPNHIIPSIRNLRTLLQN